jgi:hypothetical protein
MYLKEGIPAQLLPLYYRPKRVKLHSLAMQALVIRKILCVCAFQDTSAGPVYNYMTTTAAVAKQRTVVLW